MIDAGSVQSSARTASARARRWIGFIGYVTALSCGGHADGGAANAAAQGGKSHSGSGGSSFSFGSGGSAGSGGSTGTGGTFDAGPQPVVSCGAGKDASADLLDGASCAPSRSRCIDELRLAYYTDGRCVDGHCVWTTQVLTCVTDCVVDGCRNNPTAPVN
jgi:hypothetical protein